MACLTDIRNARARDVTTLGCQMLSDVNFTPRADKSIDFSDQDQTYKAVLHRCPD